MNSETLANKVLSSKAGREVSPDVVREAVRWALERYSSKDAEKAVKTRLHQMYGSYVEDGHIKEANRIVSALEQNQLDSREAALKLMALHSSTRERLQQLKECYGKLLSACGRPESVLDIACGFNPLSFYLLGLTTVRITAIDAGCDIAALLNRFFAAAGMANARAVSGDARIGIPAGQVDLALVMKFLPLCERMEKGGALKLLRSIDAKYIVVSFPTKTLSGRNVGMEGNYALWFEGLGYEGKIISKFNASNELFYLISTR